MAYYGGLDLHVKATKKMISNANSIEFAEKQGDFLISNKIAVLYLNEIGEMLRNTSSEPEYLEGISNIELVKDLLQYLSENKDLQDLIEKDNWLIKKEDHK